MLSFNERLKWLNSHPRVDDFLTYSEVSNLLHTKSRLPLCYAFSAPTTVVLLADF
jgi:hypothetical protein